jgi:hypothetical protein
MIKFTLKLTLIAVIAILVFLLTSCTGSKNCDKPKNYSFYTHKA